MTHRDLDASLQKQSAEGGLAAVIVRPVASGREVVLLQARGHLAKTRALEKFCEDQLARIHDALRHQPGLEIQLFPATAEMAIYGPAEVLRALVRSGGLIERDPNLLAFAHVPVPAA